MRKTISWRLPAMLLFSLVLAGLQSCTPKSETEPTPVLSGPPSTTYPMPPIKGNKSLAQMGWSLSQGERVTMASYQNKVLVLDFYATWCAPCRESIPHLIDLQKRYGQRGLEIVGLNVGGPEDRAAVPDFAREFKIHYPLGFPDEDLGQLLLSDNDAIPQTFVFDRRGRLVQRYIGYGEATGNELEQTIRSALSAAD